MSMASDIAAITSASLRSVDDASVMTQRNQVRAGER
jgi:hypothetical protein